MDVLSGQAHLYRVDILFRDDSLVVVNKPSGLVVHKGWDHDEVNTMRLVRRITRRRVSPVHRLDRGTSGCLVFAFDGQTAGRLQDHFREKTIEKRYLALTRGVLKQEEGVVDHPVPKKLKKKDDRVDAVTRYRRLGVALDRYSLVEAFPATGRLHQIRRHMKHLSHPLIGDTRYGDGEENRKIRAGYGLLRLGLHAASIKFRHPHSGEPLDIVAPLPDDFRVPLERMGFDPAHWPRAQKES
ncbi:MAG: RluA family pseudouridine synthase [Sandaracinaceae bacterium]